MDVFPYAARLHRDLRAAAEPGGESAVATAELLTAALESSIRLVLLDAVVEAAAEISRELAPGTVDVRLRGRDVDFVVTGSPAAAGPLVPAPPNDPAEPDDGTTVRLSLRVSERLKTKVEAAAAGAGLSINAWLVRQLTALVEPSAPPLGRRHTGWAR
ncbi:toxin-antitoxin system HicB family antitoxin [Skermania piniformis]|uniref:Toxin-antitoxin system HicB family antitoxin n=1 Tax=Skermania pinensis TaxID=39122 RepID=A0ABX8SDG8_9ACTN|nr:toxin-antitoxin system HicB family antitoxin [Skermania piniformis]QXQ13711.1 toxin-antitoxin system HicB family antitoxin [Skermania piniformis]